MPNDATLDRDRLQNFDAITLAIASPEQILGWSHGEVTKPETINYRTQKPERDGLFCEKIFGPSKNWECYCGKYKRVRYKGVVCEKCGVEVTRSVVRRERIGHIKLAVPVTHIWFLRSTPSRIGLLLNLPIKTLEQVIYFAAYIVKSLNEAERETALKDLEEEHKKQQNSAKEEYREKSNELKAKHKAAGTPKDVAAKEIAALEDEAIATVEEIAEQYHSSKDDLEGLEVGKVISEISYRDLSMKFGHVFQAGIGAEAVQDIIAAIDLDKFIEEREAELKKATGQKYKKTIKRLKLASSFKKAGIRPEWMVLTALPVIPPDLRPMVHLDGGRFAASDLNDLYRRVINRNNRLKRLMEIGAPEVICRNEKRMMQEAVDTLLHNSARSAKAVFSVGDKRKLRSLSDMLKGKQGRFRQNLLGKRVDYSGRSVIVVGPKLKLSECGLPKEMALKLFKPFVIGNLVKKDLAYNVKSAEKLIEENRREVWDALEEVIAGRYVMLNRAPTLHRLGIQAFQPVLIEGKAIQVHPLVCPAFNADFDGDQMAVHLPLSTAGQKEARELIAATQNMLKPATGDPTIAPTQDMVLGCYYLTLEKAGEKGEGMAFADISEAVNAYRSGFVTLHAKIAAKTPKHGIQHTTIGRLILNSFLPSAIGYQNKIMGKNALKHAVSEAAEKCGQDRAVRMCDDLKRIGFKFATKSGLTISMSDVVVPNEKFKIVADGDEVIKEINNQFWKGLITDDERYHHTIKVWSEAKQKISKTIQAATPVDNDIYVMIDSGARGNWGQVTQLAGMKGLVANPAGKTIELPVKSSLKEGFTILEYFIATHGGRKGKSDTALKTAEAGYLTRRLVDAVQDIIVREADCGSKDSVIVNRAEVEKIGEEFQRVVFGRTLAAPLADPKTGELLADTGTEIDRPLVAKINELKIDNIAIRSILTCQTENGVCQRCYGRDLGRDITVEVGTAVGIIAAQSIGEPGTQLTMRTFHMGGVAGESDITQGLTRVEELFEARTPKAQSVVSEISGKAKVHKRDNKTIVTVIANGESKDRHYLTGYEPAVKEGQHVKAKQIIARALDSRLTIKSPNEGIVDRITSKEIIIAHSKGNEKEYEIPARAALRVKTGDLVTAGDQLTYGHLNLRHLMELTDVTNVQRYIVKEVQSIYTAQGQSINDKHVEVIVRQMFSKARVLDPGDTDLLPGEVVDIVRLRRLNKALRETSKVEASAEQMLLGLTRVSLHTDSWLSAASFQETIRVLVEASTTKKVDNLRGLKENVIIGKLIPAGKTYQKMHPEALTL
ncbi:MAG: DNA-directed RNA polymerase subunit beta' [Candidatus Gracilibacteria bacterium]|jgi:DNA-directed RNA polymerase subunit beta'